MPNWPGLFRHLGTSLPQLNLMICLRAVQDLGVCEDPPGSNGGPDINSWNLRAQAPAGSFWCASWATAVWEDAGASVPAIGRASCDELVMWGKANGSWVAHDPVTRTPEVFPGSLVVYTNGKPLASNPAEKDAVHVGVVVRVTPYLMSMEGNAALGGGFTNNGEAVVLRRVDMTRVYGFVAPRRKAP